ncbi:hypothetical protein OH76DRAFT_1246690 [Lentinus brumalis]|uniref:Uncharacterized protein n=1 Tax=Lentinus brumalis TaxID=2498619 RepID=A0A371CRU8_9APHY|nr:hypothetical protein OH76DRAFT_1246690 [Polyporus brumalis]
MSLNSRPRSRTASEAPELRSLLEPFHVDVAPDDAGGAVILQPVPPYLGMRSDNPCARRG